VPISIKDVLFTAGGADRQGIPRVRHEVPDLDDNDVARLKGAGFIMLGKTNTPEFAIYPWTEPEMFGPTRNPWDTDLTPEGSTGGGGAALAAGLCPASEGTYGVVRSVAMHHATASSGSSLRAEGSPAPHASES
jgi:Asp-tRNA(Asn)/Glu-tRNA(Gln) amidotransferase A subunit family amidase